MRIAVVSDIHGNLPALEAVLSAIDAEEPAALWCLGDCVGYGPWPNEVTAIVRERADVCLVGNHDLVALDAADVSIEEFNLDAAAAARWTQAAIDDRTRTFLEGLQPSATVEGVELHHASPRDPVWEYVLTVEAALAAFEASRADVVVVGHSHAALSLTLEDGTLSGGAAAAGTEVELAPRRLLNPGSVGQPRDGDPRAAYLTLDLEGRRARFARVEYDVERAQQAIAAAGLPPALAERLARGV